MAEAPLLFLVRHGRTAANLESRYVGWSDHRLDETGLAQAEELARRLAGEGIQRVFSSPVRRCVQTAEILADRWDASVRTVHDLHELETGEWKGLSEEEVEERWPGAYREWRENPHRVEVAGRESLRDVRHRALRAVDQIGRAQLSEPDVPAVVVTHLAIIRVLWLEAQGRLLSEYQEIPGPFCREFPVRWLGRGKLATAGPAPGEAGETSAENEPAGKESAGETSAAGPAPEGESSG